MCVVQQRLQGSFFFCVISMAIASKDLCRGGGGKSQERLIHDGVQTILSNPRLALFQIPIPNFSSLPRKKRCDDNNNNRSGKRQPYLIRDRLKSNCASWCSFLCYLQGRMLADNLAPSPILDTSQDGRARIGGVPPMPGPTMW